MIAENIYSNFLDCLIRGERKKSTDLILGLLDQGADLRDIYILVFQRALTEIGDLWQKNKITVAQEHLSTATIQSIIMLLYSYMKFPGTNGKKAVISCVGRELHEVGARMVSDFFELEGWDVRYLGANVPERDIYSTLMDFRPDILGISCTMPAHVESVRNIIIQARSILPQLIITVGGYAFNRNQELYKYVGADLWAPDARYTVELCGRMTKAGESDVKP